MIEFIPFYGYFAVMGYYVQLVKEAPSASKVIAMSDRTFKAAVDIVQNLPKEGSVNISNEQRLLFYSLYKQATVGECNTSKPSFWNVVEKYKWEAWKALGNMEKETAMQKYVEMLNMVVDKAMAENSFAFVLNEQDCDLENTLRPNFEILGYDWRVMFSTPLRQQSAYSYDDAETNCSKTREKAKAKKPSGSFDSLPDYAEAECLNLSKGCSDDDYDDATDVQERVSPVAGISDVERRLSPTSPPCDISSDLNEQRETCKGLTALTLRLTRMMEVLAEQQKVFSCFVQNVRARMDKPVMNWKIFIFLVIWPIIVNLLIRYLPYIRLLF